MGGGGGGGGGEGGEERLHEVTVTHHYKYNMEVSPFPAKLCG